MSEKQSDYLEALNRIWKEGGHLLKAEAIVDKDAPADPIAIVLSFQHGAITVSAVPADDTVSVEQGKYAVSSDEFAIDLQGTLPWSGAIGRSAMFAWLMTNQQLYIDGVQLQFAKPVEDTSVIVQMVTFASALRILEVHRPNPVNR